MMTFLAFAVIAMIGLPIIMLVQKGLGTISKDTQTKQEMKKGNKDLGKAWVMFTLLIVIAILFAILSGCNSAQKEQLMKGHWKLTSMETLNHGTKKYNPDTTGSFSDFAITELEGTLFVRFTQGNIFMPCKMKGDEIWSKNGEYKIFTIVEITDKKLVMKQTVVNRIYIDLGEGGCRVEFVNRKT